MAMLNNQMVNQEHIGKIYPWVFMEGYNLIYWEYYGIYSGNLKWELVTFETKDDFPTGELDHQNMQICHGIPSGYVKIAIENGH